MKIVIDRINKLTRGDSKNDKQIILKNLQITTIPIDLFKKFGLENIDSTIKVIDTKTALAQYKELLNKVFDNINLQKKINQKFLSILKTAHAHFDDILLQKITYKLDQDEELNDVVKVLKNINSNALFRAIEFDKALNTVISYSSREGIWEINGNLIAKSIELRSIGSIRTDRALRSVRDPNKFINIKRVNYHLFEDTKQLIENNIIKNSYCTREQADHSYKDDTRVVYISKIHFKKDELTKEDLVDLDIAKQVSFSIKEETTHVNKRQATTAQVEQSLEDNKKEIHTKYDPLDIIKEEDESLELKNKKEDTLKSYISNLLNNLDIKQKKEREELTYKINSALGKERQKAKQIFITSLSNGMTILEAIDNLRAAKNNDVMIQVVLEEIKTDIILSLKKDEIISSQSKELNILSKKFETTLKKFKEIDHKNSYNYKAYQIELLKRQKADETISNIQTYLDKFKAMIESQKIEIVDLIDENKEKDREIKYKEKELEEQFNTIAKLNNDINSKDKMILSLQNSFTNFDKKVDEFISNIDKK